MEKTELRNKVRELIAAEIQLYDFYSDLAREIFGDNFTKEHRDMVKTAVFQVLYALPKPPGADLFYGVSPLVAAQRHGSTAGRLFGRKEEE